MTSNKVSVPNAFDSLAQHASSNRGGLRYCPYAFTEYGIVMLASLLKSAKAVDISVRIVNAFVVMRKFIFAHSQVFQRIENIEQRQVATDDKVNDFYSFHLPKCMSKVFCGVLGLVEWRALCVGCYC